MEIFNPDEEAKMPTLDTPGGVENKEADLSAKYAGGPIDEHTHGKPMVASTMEEATAECSDCGVNFPTPHKEDCPQLEGQAAIQQEIAKEEAEGEVQKITPAMALKHVQLYVAKVENYLNPELIKQLGGESITVILKDLIKIAGMSVQEEATDENS